jgi:Fur family transcriptional regulator, ferric uptake regulator
LQRKTQQRAAIRNVLLASGRPMSPQEILDAAQTEVPGLGIATVYRNVKSLLDEGWLKEVELPGQPSRYEIGGKAHHHHFLCRACDRVFEIDQCPGALAHLAPPGFKPEGHEILLFGLCQACAA